MCKLLLQSAIALVVTGFVGSDAVGQPVCTPGMTPNQCVEAQLKAAGEILGKYKSEIARFEAEIARLRNEIVELRSKSNPQVGFMPCYKKFKTSGEQQLTVPFSLGDCQGVVPKKDWTYTATLVGTTICGGFNEYRISPDPFQPYIHFYGSGFCPSDQSEVWVHYIGFSPRAF